MKEAQFWKPFGDGVRCGLCPRKCIIAEGKDGFCHARGNRVTGKSGRGGGKLFALTYGRPVAINIDPIEKKPLFHFAPGTRCLSIATAGCNLDCSFCQNWEISHPSTASGRSASAGSSDGGTPESRAKHSSDEGTPGKMGNPHSGGGDEVLGQDYADPEAVVEMAKANGVPGIAYTYTEPTVFFEYAYDIMKLARKEGLYNVWVSNGYTSPAPARKAARFMDAINVDLKGDAPFYRALCSVPDEKPMHSALKVYKEAGVWIETTTLLIPGKNDSPEIVEGIVKWVKGNLGVSTPVHFSRFFPHFRMKDTPPTQTSKLDMAANIAKSAGMKYVYIGNVAGQNENTLCPKCGAVVVERHGYDVDYKQVCPKCKTAVQLAGMKWV